jgi:tetratricopeptide (TPR) repeat protein
LSDENSAAVADICRRLDGIPFAIELAAARVKALSIADLSHALNERFRILTGGHRTALPRQKTMRALIDWSFDLLSESEKALLCRVAIFAGGWTLDAATQICQGNGIDEFEVLDLLASLVDKSLVVAETGGDVTRYRLLDSTREYALEKLADDRSRLSRAHAEFYGELAAKAYSRWSTTPTQEWVDELEPELDNFRGALEWTLNGSNDPSLGALLAGQLGFFWFYGGLNPEGMRWINNGLGQVSGKQPAAEATLLLARSMLVEGKPLLEAAERALALFEGLGDRVGAARAMYRLGTGLRTLGRMEEAESAFFQSANILRQSGDKKDYAISVGGIATVNWICGKAEEAHRLFDEQRRAAAALMDDDIKTMCLANLAELEFSRGNAEQAIALSLESIGLQRKNYLKVALDYCNLTAYRIALGQIEQARNDARSGLHWAQEVQNEFQIALALHHLALIAALNNDARRAAALLGFAESIFARFEYVREPTEGICYERLMGLLQKQLREEEIAAMRSEGATWSEEHAIEEALKV